MGRRRRGNRCAVDYVEVGCYRSAERDRDPRRKVTSGYRNSSPAVDRSAIGVDGADGGRRSLNEFGEVQRPVRGAGKAGQAKRFGHCPKKTLVLIKTRGVKTRLTSRTDDYRSHMAPTIRQVGTDRFIEGYDQQTVLSKCGTCDQRLDVRAEPVVSSRKFVRVGAGGVPRGTIVSVVLLIRNDE